MSSSSDQHQAAPADAAPTEIEILRGRAGVVGRSRVGVSSIVATPPPFQGGLPGARATLIEMRDAPMHVESTLVVGEKMLLPLADGLHRVSKLATPSESDRQGHVVIDTEAARAGSPHTVFVSEEGRLRIGGPEVKAAYDVRVLAWTPDKHAPQSATLEWLTAAFPRDSVPAQQIKQQAVKVGDRLQVGAATLTVKAVEGQTQDHPAWIEFELSPGG
ncbi:hypothetical protein [Dyella sp. 2RAB6]|uniref:hypothetical protein n=1 Tax=Dyella sp. 2RAB6 TaxID=3232992 RepID=UPI003F9237D8